MQQADSFIKEYLVTEDVYNGFIGVSNDRNILHTNETFAKDKGFSGKVMHGNILNAFLSHFIGECLPVKNVIIHSQEIKFLKPVYLNDTLTLNAEITDFFESVKAYIFKFRFINQHKIIVATGKIQIGLI